MRYVRAFAVVITLAAPVGSSAAEFDGTIVGVADGDTVTLSTRAERSTGSGLTASMRLSARNRTASVRASLWPTWRTAGPRAQTAPKLTAMDARCVACWLAGSTSASSSYAAASRGTTSNTRTSSVRLIAPATRALKARRV